MWLGASNRSNTGPIKLAVTGTTSTTVSLSWTPGNTRFYNLYVNGLVNQLGLAGTTFTVTGLTPSTAYTFWVRGVIAAGEQFPQSNTVNVTTQASSGTQVKLIKGNGFWPANQFWRGTAGTVYRNNILPLTRNNVNLTLFEMVGCWADFEGATRGDYSLAFNSIDAVLADLVGITTHKVGLIVKLWLTFFATEPGLPSRTSTTFWPQYTVNNGWPTSFYEAQFGRSQLQWDIDGVWDALGDLLIAIGQRYNSHPNFLGLSFQDESEAISVISNMPDNPAHPEITQQPAPWTNGQTVINSTHYCDKLLQMYYDMSDAMPNTLAYMPWNFLPPGGTQALNTMNSMMASMIATRPGKFMFGGPDPWTHSTTFHQAACGLIGPDVRTQVAMIGNVEQGSETASGNPSASAIYARNIGTGAATASPLVMPGHCQMQIWPYLPDGTVGQVTTVTPIVNAIAANGGQTAPLPVVGNYITT